MGSKRWVLIALLSSTAGNASSAELTSPEPIPGATRYTIRSEKLDESRTVLVRLPDTYDSDTARAARYPVLYLLDGRAYFDLTAGIVHHLGSPEAAVQAIPDHIVVAVRNTERSRDMTPTSVAQGLYSKGSGGAANFRRFLGSELIPAIDSRFRTSPRRVLVGHSLAGLFVLDTFIEQPELFDAYIALDPSAWWDGNLPAKKLANRHATITRPLFIAQAHSAGADDPHTVGIRQFVSALEKNQALGRSCYRYFEDETHYSIPLQGIYHGLRFVYAEDEATSCPPAR